MSKLSDLKFKKYNKKALKTIIFNNMKKNMQKTLVLQRKINDRAIN